MAEIVLHPDPIAAFPGGTTVKIYKRPVGAPAAWVPSGAALSEPTVSAAGALKVEGLEENALYVATAVVGGTTKTLQFVVVPAPSSEGAVSSVNGKAGAVVLTAADVEALGAASPVLTGTPTAPTAAEADNSTKLATTKYADRAVSAEATARAAADTTEKSARETADGLALAKASNLSDLANAATARTSLGLGTAATQASGAFDAAGAAATAQAAAEAAGAPHMAVHASVITNATTATVNQLHPVNDEAESRTIKLPAGQAAGSRVAVEKSSATNNEVAIEGSMRGEAAQTIKLRLSKQTIVFLADAAGSWWPIALFCPLATLSTDYVLRTIAVPAGVAPGNELLAEWKIKLHGSEKRTLVEARIRTVSGTIKVAIKRGEAGATEIAAYKELKGAETEEVVTSEQALSDKDRITVTASGGATPKGLFIDVWEKVEK